MKKLLILLGFVAFCNLGTYAQFDNNNPKEGNHFTYGDLEELGKLPLTKIYIDQVHRINLLLPYIPFNQKGDAISLANMGIPDTKDNNGAVKTLDGSGGNHNEALDETLNNIIPYADKIDIIKSILFLQDMIEKIETGI